MFGIGAVAAKGGRIENRGIAGGCEPGGKIVFPGGSDDSARSIPEQNTAGPIRPVDDPGHSLCADDEDMLRMPGPQVHFGDIHGKDETRAGSIDIKSRAFCSDSTGDDAGSGRSDMVALDGGTYD